MEFLWTNWLVGFLWGATWSIKIFGAFCSILCLGLVMLLTLALFSGLLSLLGLAKIKDKKKKDAN